MTRKLAIFDETEQKALIGACEGDREYIPVWLMLKCGMHPHDITHAKEKFRFNGQFLEWKRAKNSNLRREIVPKDLLPRLKAWVESGQKLTRIGYNHLVHRVGERVGHPEYSPLTLRHTFGLQELRKTMNKKSPIPDPFAFVAQKMGCRRDTVLQYYIDADQWADLGED